jgi:hypothetical protein
MPPLRVWIAYQPKIYTDVLKEAFQSQGLAEVITEASAHDDHPGSIPEYPGIDLVVLSLDNLGRPELGLTSERLQNSRLIAFSPNGDYGLMRSPGKTCWEEVHPFGLKHLLALLSGE